MKLLLKIIVAVAANGLGLWLCGKYIPGFHLTTSLAELAVMALALMALNIVLKPILTFFLSPFIVLTLGLLLIVINAAMLYLLDIFSPQLTIDDVSALILSTLIVGAVNGLAHLFRS